MKKFSSFLKEQLGLLTHGGKTQLMRKTDTGLTKIPEKIPHHKLLRRKDLGRVFGIEIEKKKPPK